MSQNQNRIDTINSVTDQLNGISPSMCLAKWLQSTTTLYNGMTHSCHHPVPHKIEVADVVANPKALHNTPIKFYARKEMLEGIQTAECKYCWNIENLGAKHISDRSYKSVTQWAWPSLQKVLDSGLGEDINPTYLEVAFENTCNFKCAYCSPEVSSRWMEEIKVYGPYNLTHKKHHDLKYLASTNRIPIHYKEQNPYIDAFWKWWPELYQDLKVFRITGGEPLLSEHTWKVLDYIEANPRSDLTLAINTNMGVPKKLVQKLIEYCNRIAPHIKELQIFTSAEATGKQCEYIRHGMVWDEFTENCDTFLTQVDPQIRLNFMVTTNLLGSTTFDKFIEYIMELRRKFNSNVQYNRIPIMISYVRWPEHLSVTNLPDNLKSQYTSDWKKCIADNRNTLPARLYLEEIDQIERLIEFMNSVPQIDSEVADFYHFHAEYDIRRHESVCETFPELSEHYTRGQQISMLGSDLIKSQ